MESFDDPNLKTALKRASGAEAAPAQLRRRIQEIVSANTPAKSPAQLPRPVTLVWGLAMAASVALAFGVYSIVTRQQPPPVEVAINSPATRPAPDALPGDVAKSMAATHDGCCKSTTHDHVKGDFAAIGQILAKDLKVPVIATAVDNWKFSGAAECRVYGYPSAHLLYRRDNKTLSIFTLPVSDFSLPPADKSFNNSTNGHYLASFIKGPGLYCVVEYSTDGSATATDAAQIRDQLLKDFATDSVAYDPGNDSVASNEQR